ncbi:hypothetical protein HPB47_001897, partial [Ixodes persulcatus]
CCAEDNAFRWFLLVRLYYGSDFGSSFEYVISLHSMTVKHFETWLDPSVADGELLCLDDFTIIRRDRQGIGGGVMMAIPSQLCVNRRTDLEHPDLEGLFVEYHLPRGPILQVHTSGNPVEPPPTMVPLPAVARPHPTMPRFRAPSSGRKVPVAKLAWVAILMVFLWPYFLARFLCRIWLRFLRGCF